jgi:hypothetical protein
VPHAVYLYDWFFSELAPGCTECLIWALHHEIGHGLETAGTRDLPGFAKAVGYSSTCLLADVCTYGKPPPGATDGYAASKIDEDFAQTFAYVIAKVNGQYDSSRLPQAFAPPNRARQQYFVGIVPALREDQLPR